MSDIKCFASSEVGRYCLKARRSCYIDKPSRLSNAASSACCSDVRRKTHASAGPRDVPEIERLPKGPHGDTWSNATVVQNK